MERVQLDYQEFSVYRWLSGEHKGKPRRFRKKIVKPNISTIDITSGESASEGEGSQTRPTVHFLDKDGESSMERQPTTITRSRLKHVKGQTQDADVRDDSIGPK
ncbi:Hypothetical predicted protein, partial [Pelobates cultripes]